MPAPHPPPSPRPAPPPSMIQDLDIMVMVFHHFGKDFPKSEKLSPDAFVQMALQLAYYRCAPCPPLSPPTPPHPHGGGTRRPEGGGGPPAGGRGRCSAPSPPPRIYKQACATYESASLRMFHLGRTDTIRSASMDSLAFVKAMDDPSVSVRGLG